MSHFWGYTGAGELAILVIGGVSLACLISAWIFVKNYGE
jgi:hypothetical protein